jgi:tetratricopeptide (TPR) repeat protein
MKKQQWYLFIILILTLPTIAMTKEIEEISTIDDNGIMGSQIFNFIGIEYKDLGRLDEAERVLLLGVEYYNSYNLAYNLAGVFIENGNKENAKLALQIAKIRKDNSGVIILPDDEPLTNKKSKRPPHQYFSPEEVKHLTIILVKELKLYYQECEKCEHINMFLGNLYSKQGDYLKAIQYFDREMIVNVNDISGFSSSSSLLRGLYKNKLSNQEKLKYIVSIKEVEKLVDSLNMLNKKLNNRKDTKSEISKNTLLAFSIFEDMKSIISRDLEINLGDNFKENIKVLNVHADFKLPEKPKIIKKIESNSEVFKTFETSNDIYLLLQYFSRIIAYNMPIIK